MPQYNSKHKTAVLVLWMFILFLSGFLINRGIGFFFKDVLELLLHQLCSNNRCFSELLSKHTSQDSHTCPLLTSCNKTNEMEVFLVIPVLERHFFFFKENNFVPCVVTEKQQVHNINDHSDSTTYAYDAQRTHLQNFNVFMLKISRLTIGPKFFEFQNDTKQKSQ